MSSILKVLCHPASVDTISTSGAKEDHVSMGGFAAHKAVEVVQNVEDILAIEIMAACQVRSAHTYQLSQNIQIVDQSRNVDLFIVCEYVGVGT